MSASRAVPILRSASPATSAAFYESVVGMRLAMDIGWVAFVASPDRPEVQLGLISRDATAPIAPVASVEVDDVDAAHAAAVAAGAEIVHPLSDEEWGVRRFFLRDADGNVVNVLAHRSSRTADAADEDAAAPSSDGTDPDVASFVAQTALERDGIRLVPLTTDHAEGLAAAAADGELWRLTFTSVPEPGAESAYVATALATPDRVPFAVLDADGTVIGSTSFHDVLPGPRRLSIGYTWYAGSRQRTAVNTTCKLLLLDHAFETVGARTVGWITDGINHRSQQAIERLGARKDGVLRGAGLRRDGSVRDTVAYSLTADEWPAVRDRLERRLAAGGNPPTDG
jgi:RimJ/RimL family protein N-acetyltransferase/predicted enzyme related to lactoylglutathione lyase